MTTQVKELNYYVNLSIQERVDLEFWLRFLLIWNGVNMFIIFRTVTCNHLWTHPQHKVLGNFITGNGLAQRGPKNYRC
jgi:hypothetical protein